jgi:hopanoid biosynthesis associated RND transporter like protein HpnN
MSESKDTLVLRLLRRLVAVVFAHPRWFVWPQYVLFAVCVWYTVSRLEFDMDRNNLVGSDKQYHRNFLALKKEFPGQDDLVAVVESEDLEKNRQFVERLGARLDALSTQVSPTNLFTDVFYKGDLKLMGRKALLFVPETNLVELQKALGDYQPFLKQFASSSNLASLFGQVNTQIRTSAREQNAQTDSLLKALPALERIVKRAQQSLARSGQSPSPGVDALFGAGEEAEREKYITFAGGRIYLVSAKASREDLNEAAVEKFRKLVQDTKNEVQGVNVGVTGEPVLEFDEMQQSQKDSTVATVISLALSAIIFVVGYNQTGRPLKAVWCLVIGLGYTMGYATLTVGHLNILTITFVPMLIGLAIDFGVHLITRFEEELRHGRSERVAMERAMVNTGQGIFTGCFTTAGAFFAMALTDFKGIQEMGVITGGALLICLVPMMTLLPVMLLRPGRQNVIDEAAGEAEMKEEALESFEAGGERVDTRARLERLWLDRPWAVIGVVGALCLLSAAAFPRVFFDYNLLNMQSDGLPAVVFEHKLIRSAEKSVLYGAVVATNLDEAVALEAKLQKLPSVASTDSMARYLAEKPESKLALIRSIGATAGAVQFAPPDTNVVSLADLSQTLWSLQGYLRLAVDEVAKTDDKELLASLKSLIDVLGGLRVAMFHGDEKEEAENARRLAGFQQALFNDIRDTFGTLQHQDASGGLRPEDLPVALRNRFIGVTGKHLIQVYPKADVWERAPQETFVKELQGVAPTATGTPVQLFYYTELLKDSYIKAAWWALAAIVLLVFLHFRRLGSVVLSLLPVLIGTFWVIGMMGWAGIPFNPANIMMLPLVIGIGVTNGIHILNRFAEEHSPSILAKSTGKAVLVSALTTIAGFGSLIVADHRGIRSLGYIMATGTAACMLAGLTFLPAVLTLMERRRRAKKLAA